MFLKKDILVSIISLVLIVFYFFLLALVLFSHLSKLFAQKHFAQKSNMITLVKHLG